MIETLTPQQLKELSLAILRSIGKKIQFIKEKGKVSLTDI